MGQKLADAVGAPEPNMTIADSSRHVVERVGVAHIGQSELPVILSKDYRMLTTLGGQLVSRDQWQILLVQWKGAALVGS